MLEFLLNIFDGLIDRFVFKKQEKKLTTKSFAKILLITFISIMFIILILEILAR